MGVENWLDTEPMTEKRCQQSDYDHAFREALNEMRLNKQHCDFCLDVRGEKIYVHKVALIFASPYFAGMLNNDMQEKASGSAKYDEDPAIVEALVEYIYSGVITLTKSNVQSILPVANLFQMEWVKEQSEQFLKSQVRATNCFEMRSFADMYSCKELLDYSQSYILQHFDEIIYAEEFLSLPFEEIKKLIMDENVSVKFEDNAYKAVVKWIKHDLEERKAHLRELMSHVRLPFVRPEFLRRHIITEPLLRSDQECSQVLIEAFNYQLTPVSERNSLCGQGRETSSSNSGTRVLNTAERYDTYKKQWSYISPMSVARRNFGICTYNDRIYVVGGNQVSSVESYDPVTNLWTKCANTPATYDNGNRAAVIGNSIYSMGCDAWLIRLDPREGRWNNLDKASRDLQTEFELVSYDVSLFCIGSNCHRFDVRTHKWEPMPSMLSKLNRRSAVMIADDIYLIGWKKIERYNIHDNEWVIVDSTALEFYDGGAAVMSDYS
uniref:BTB domain-containing protein n=1 Tax=Glossina morsitans morsitans TaxID=37546 RepID=A0A1B0G3N6_GLOMM